MVWAMVCSKAQWALLAPFSNAMICKIADLIAEVPAAYGLDRRCADYLYSGDHGADIIIRTDLYRFGHYHEKTPTEVVAYMESAFQFYNQLLNFGGFYLHSSAVVRDGKAYLFSGHSGVGKSTHVRLWIDTFGGDTRVINDDKPALRCIDGVWYAYGTPWCGKDGININERVPVAGLCFLKQADHNSIRILSSSEAVLKILGQTIFRFQDTKYADALMKNMESFLSDVPVYELENLPDRDAALLSYNTMFKDCI